VFYNGLTPASVHPNAPTVPEFAYSMFQLMFAIITVALISGALVERLRFKAWSLFTVFWSIIVYTPLAHWVWNPEGSSGTWALSISRAAWSFIPLRVFPPWWRCSFWDRASASEKTPINPPANIGYVFIGAALLWVGWFGFNSGSAVAAMAWRRAPSSSLTWRRRWPGSPGWCSSGSS